MSEGAPLPIRRRVDEIAPRGASLEIEADAAARAAIAAFLGIEAVAALTIRFALARRGRGDLHVALDYEGRFTRTCVVTLEPFDQAVRGHAERLYTEHARENGAHGQTEEIDPLEEADTEPLADGVVDLGAYLAEMLALDLDPYPRKPGARLDAGEGADPGADPTAPFAALARLRDRRES